VGAPPAGEAGGGADDDFFPIEDYDDLEVAEILPLVPELYEDELDMVEARERDTKGRAAVLARIDEVRRSTSGDTGDGAQVVDEVAESDDDFFPIEDYDDLKVAEILPLLPELYPDELDLVERYERAGKGRVSIINRLAELRDTGDDDAPELEDAPDDVAMPVMVKEDVDAGEDEEFFPIEDYDELTVGEILPLLPELYEDELDVVEDRERANKNRAVVINRLAELRDAGDDDASSPATPVLDDDDDDVDEGEWEVPDEGWDQSAAAEVEPDNEDEDVDVFPIADYDRLRVSEIRSVLPELSEEELEVVRDAERRGASRITILTAINRELGVEAAPPAKKAVRSRKASSAKKLAPARKATVKKSTTKKAAAKKVATKRAATVKKAGVKKVGAKKVGTKKAGVKKVGAKKVGTKKAGVKKVGAKKVGTKRTTARRL